MAAHDLPKTFLKCFWYIYVVSRVILNGCMVIWLICSYRIHWKAIIHIWSFFEITGLIVDMHFSNIPSLCFSDLWRNDQQLQSKKGNKHLKHTTCLWHEVKKCYYSEGYWASLVSFVTQSLLHFCLSTMLYNLALAIKQIKFWGDCMLLISVLLATVSSE